MLETLFNEVEGRLKGDLAEIPDWAGKFVGSVLRISGILHVMKYPKDSMFDFVDKVTMESAVTIGRYFLEHAKAAYSLMGADVVNKNAQYLLSAIKRERLTEFSRRDAMRRCCFPRVSRPNVFGGFWRCSRVFRREPSCWGKEA